jgi:hypothetical protein
MRSQPLSLLSTVIEHREIAFAAFRLEPDPDRPDIFRLQRALLTDQASLVHGSRRRGRDIGFSMGMVASDADPPPQRRSTSIGWTSYPIGRSLHRFPDPSRTSPGTREFDPQRTLRGKPIGLAEMGGEPTSFPTLLFNYLVGEDKN